MNTHPAHDSDAVHAAARDPAAAPSCAGRERRRLGWDPLHSDHRTLWLIGIAAFLTRAGIALATRNARLGADPTDYDRLGRLLAAGKGFGPALLSPSGGPTAFRPPLYPLFLGAVYKLTGGSIFAARLVQAALGAVSVVLIWLIARRLFNLRVANASAALAALYPPLVMATEALMSESIFVPIMLAAILAALVARDDGGRAIRWALLAGVFAGLGLLARPNSLAMLPAILLLVTRRARPRRPRRSAIGRAWLVLIGVAAVITPWQIRNAMVMHHFVPISDIDGYNAAGIYNQDAASSPYPTRYQWRPPNSVAGLGPLFSDQSLDEVTLGQALRDAGIDFVRSHPTAPLQAEAWNTFRMLELTGLNQSARAASETGYNRSAAAIGMVSFWIVGALAILGATTRLARQAPRAFWLAPVFLWIGTALFLGEPRLRAPIEPFIVLSAGVAIEMLVARARPGSVTSRVRS